MQVIIELPESAFSALRVSPTEFARNLTVTAIVKWYEMGRISQAKGAEMCGVTRAEFVEILSSYQASIIQYDEDSLNNELAP